MTPSMPVMLPIMSLLRMPMISRLSWMACAAMILPPKRPCSSPDRPTKMMLLAKSYLLSTLAASSTPAMPEALSLAPGESSVPLRGSEIRLSISPDMIIYLSGYTVPRFMASTLTMLVDTGILLLSPSSMTPLK